VNKKRSQTTPLDWALFSQQVLKKQENKTKKDINRGKFSSAEEVSDTYACIHKRLGAGALSILGRHTHGC